MPQIPQYVAQRDAAGTVRGPLPTPVDVSGLVRGITAGYAIEQHQIDEERNRQLAEAERQRRELEHNEAALHVINAESRLQERVTQATQQAQESADGMSGFTVRLLKDFDGWSKEEHDQAPENAKPILARTTARMRAQVNMHAAGLETKARQAQIVNAFGDGADADMRAALADPSTAAQAIARRRALAATLALPQDAREDMARKASEGIAFAASQAMVDRDPDGFLSRLGMAGGKTGKDGKPLPTDAKRAAEAVRADPILSQLDPGRLAQLTERATMLSVTRKAQRDAEVEHARARAEAGAAHLAREQDRAWLIVSDRLRNGIPTDPNAPELRILAGSPYAAEYAARTGDVKQGAAVASLPLAVQRAQLDALKAQRLQGTNEGLEREIQKREQILAGGESDYKREPLRAASERRLFGAQAIGPLDVSNLDAASRIEFRVQQAKIAETRTGKPVSPYLQDEAIAVARQIDALPWDQRGARVAALAAKMTPGQAQAFARQVDADNRPLALELAAGTSQAESGKTVGQYIARGRQYLKDKPQDGEKLDAIRNQIAKEVGESLQGTRRQDVIDAAVYAYLGQKGADLRPSAKGVVNLVLGGPLVEHNGAVIPVPQGIDNLKDNLRAGRYTIPAGPMFVNGQPISEADFRRLLPDATLDAAEFGQYTVRAGSGMVLDGNRNPVRVRVIR